MLALALGAGGVTAAPLVLPAGGSCDSPAGRLAAAAAAAGLPADKVPTAVAIGLAESGGDPFAVGDTAITDETWGPSVGAFQIRSLRAERGSGGVRDELALTDMAHNARSMVAISSGGENWQPWSVYTSGAYRSHLAEGEAVKGCASTATPPAGVRPDAFELVNRAATNVIYGVADRACPPTSAAELCARWQAFVGTPPAAQTGATTAGMVDVDGITVAVEAAPSLRRMIDAARLDGVELRAVSSYRTAAEQRELRERNCPDPVASPPSECTPATAKVGTSGHETGHAIDFDASGWSWLAANAERFGWSTHTVPGEPWHASYMGGL